MLDRTAELRKYGFEGRNLRKLQMTTDTAARVTRIVIEEQSTLRSLYPPAGILPRGSCANPALETLDEIPFADYPELRINKHESTQMPFRYVKDETETPIMPPVRILRTYSLIPLQLTPATGDAGFDQGGCRQEPG